MSMVVIVCPICGKWNGHRYGCSNAHPHGAQGRQWPIRAIQVCHDPQPSSASLYGRQHERDGQEATANPARKALMLLSQVRMVSRDNLNGFDDMTQTRLVFCADERPNLGEVFVTGISILGKVVEGFTNIADESQANVKAIGGAGCFLCGDESFDVHGGISCVGDVVHIGPMVLYVNREVYAQKASSAEQGRAS